MPDLPLVLVFFIVDNFISYFYRSPLVASQSFAKHASKVIKNATKIGFFCLQPIFFSFEFIFYNSRRAGGGGGRFDAPSSVFFVSKVKMAAQIAAVPTACLASAFV